VRDQPGSLAERFPVAFPLTLPLLEHAYLHIGLSAAHIELLTGQPAERILDALHDNNIPVRTFGGMSPWLQALLSST
jgi:hypothetical protein